MNSIGVDFKLKSMTLDGKTIKLQIVRIKIYITSQKKKIRQKQIKIIKQTQEQILKMKVFLIQKKMNI